MRFKKLTESLNNNYNIEYASDMRETERNTATKVANNFVQALNELVDKHNKKANDEDLEDYLWTYIYDYASNVLPYDESKFVFDNHRGQYDENGKIGILKLIIDTPNNNEAFYNIKIGYDYMDYFDDDTLEAIGIYK